MLLHRAVRELCQIVTVFAEGLAVVVLLQHLWSNIIFGPSHNIEASKKHRCPEGVLPDVVILGSKGCGESALARIFLVHTQVQVSNKEIHFYDSAENFAKGICWYLSKVVHPEPEQILLERSSTYFSSPDAPARMKATNPNAKLLVVVSDPLPRFLNEAMMQIPMDADQKAAESFLDSHLLDRTTGEINDSAPYLQGSLYAKYMQLWLQYFPLQQFYFVDGDKLVLNRPNAEFRLVQKYLNLKEEVKEKGTFYFHNRIGFYCFTQSKHGCLRQFGKPLVLLPSPSKSTHQKLRNFLHAENRKFFSLIGREFTWSGQKSR